MASDEPASDPVAADEDGGLSPVSAEVDAGLPLVSPDVMEERPGIEFDDVVPAAAHDMLSVVCLGGSAGSIGPLQQFFRIMPADSGMAFVVIVHLSPDHESNLPALIQRTTSMPVKHTRDGQRLEANHVYVIPPSKQLWMVGEHFRLVDLPRERARHMAVDLFFRALADTHGARSVAVVLSGADADGTLGIKRIKERGGLTVAQDPDEAEHPSMPRSALATGMVDWVLEIDQMPVRLMEYRSREQRLNVPSETGPHPAVAPAQALDDTEAALRDVLTFLRTRTGRDFSYYKRATIVRRVSRRLQVNGIDDLPAYLGFLRTHPGEAGALLQDLLISVTNFFRDREAFRALQARIPDLFVNKGPGDAVRVWVPACATGDEAYSIAMLLCEHARTLDAPPALQVFATDLDEDVISMARQGAYPETIAADVSSDRLARFFLKEHQGYRVRREVREMVLFAVHDLLKDAPFSRLDLVSCRNLLIYLNRDAQKRVFDIVHFALREGGRMFLGSSEWVDEGSPLFTALDKKHRLYTARSSSRATVPVPLATGTLARASQQSPAILGPSFMPNLAGVGLSREQRGDRISWGELHFKLLERFAAPSVIVNADYDILHLSERAGQFLRFGGGEPSMNLLRVVHPMLRIDLRAALFRAAQTGEAATATRVMIETGNVQTALDVSVSPATDAAPDFFLVMFHPRDVAPVSSRPKALPAAEPVVQQLEREFEQTKSQLRDTVEQYEASTEELKASNEELQAMNEELRSATEELETSREELQSMNEELTTVNQELKGKVDELGHANSDLHNLMSATAIATIFLDRELRIMRFTAPAVAIFNLILTDIGRPLADLQHRLDYPTLLVDAERVLAQLAPIEREVAESSGRFFLARLLPYRTTEHRIAGVVLTFVDVTERQSAQEALRRKEAELREAQRIAHVGSWYWDLAQDTIAYSEEILRILELDSRRAVLPFSDQQHIYTEDSWACLRAAGDEAIETGRGFELDLEMRRGPHPSVWVTVRAEVLRTEAGEVHAVRGTFQDITERKLGIEKLLASEARLQSALRIETLGVIFFNFEGRITDCNDAFLRMSGYRREDLAAPPARSSSSFDEWLPQTPPEIRQVFSVPRAVLCEKQYVRRDGSRWWASCSATRLSDVEGVAYITDISEVKAAEAELLRTHEELEGRVRERTTELDRANAALRDEIRDHRRDEKARQHLARQLVTVEENERRRISRELHDEVGQHLTAIMLGLKSLETGNDHAPTLEMLKSLRSLTERVGREIHQLAVDLRPTALDDLGLTGTLTNHLEDWSERSGIGVDFHTTGLDEDRLPGHIETTLYRIVQESLHNVLKHATGAKAASVIIERRTDHVLAIIEDDGVGFEPDAIAAVSGKRLGIAGMRERVAMLNGQFSIESRQGHGTTLFVRIPLIQ